MALPTVPDSVNNLRPELREHARLTREVMDTARIWVGRRLLEAKKLTRHGEWQPYLAVLGIKDRSAQRMMRAAAAIDSGKVPEGSSVTAALEAIADKREPTPNASDLSDLETEALKNKIALYERFRGDDARLRKARREGGAAAYEAEMERIIAEREATLSELRRKIDREKMKIRILEAQTRGPAEAEREWERLNDELSALKTREQDLAEESARMRARIGHLERERRS